jgi:hypothetical protein
MLVMPLLPATKLATGWPPGDRALIAAAAENTSPNAPSSGALWPAMKAAQTWQRDG